MNFTVVLDHLLVRLLGLPLRPHTHKRCCTLPAMALRSAAPQTLAACRSLAVHLARLQSPPPSETSALRWQRRALQSPLCGRWGSAPESLSLRPCDPSGEG